MNEDAGTSNTVDVTRVVSEEDTTEGSKGAHHVRLKGDWGFDAVDIVSCVEDCTARHFESVLCVCCM